MAKLTVKGLQALVKAHTGATKPKRIGDGDGLYAEIAPNGRIKWVYRFSLGGKVTEIGVGGNDTSLAEARERAADARKLVKAGLHPRSAQKARAVPTFGEAATGFIVAKTPQWRSSKHAGQWTSTLTSYCKPIWGVPVNQIDTETILRALRPVWLDVPETASRVRGRIEMVLDAARARGHIPADTPNPARWKGHLQMLLPTPQKLAKPHHEAMAYEAVPHFVAGLREQDSVAALVVEFIILTAVRLNNATNARWDEIDLEGRLWTIPATRMKNGREHQVPLAPRAVEILRAMASARQSDFVFPGQRAGRPVAVRSVQRVMENARPGSETIHGFRSAFRDWCGNEGDIDRETAELALAHTFGSDVERAYRQSPSLKKRREAFEAWADYCEPKTDQSDG